MPESGPLRFEIQIGPDRAVLACCDGWDAAPPSGGRVQGAMAAFG